MRLDYTTESVGTTYIRAEYLVARPDGRPSIPTGWFFTKRSEIHGDAYEVRSVREAPKLVVTVPKGTMVLISMKPYWNPEHFIDVCLNFGDGKFHEKVPKDLLRHK